mgnify:CR=1 FL=1
MVFITAEIGINHNGDIEIAKNLIEIAKSAGCDAVKFQKRAVEKVYSKSVLDSPRESPWGKTTRDQKLGLEFGKKEYDEINQHCLLYGIDWFASSWDLDSQSFLCQYDLKYNKIASAMLTNSELLKTVAKEKKHTFISTGMSTMEEIGDAVNIFREHNCPFELMHTNSSYPMKIEEANLLCITMLKKKFNCDVGYSGHEVSAYRVSLIAVSLGATSIERHITLDRTMYGSDQAASVEPQGFIKLVNGVRTISEAIGSGDIRFNPKELDIAKKLRAHLK